MGKTSLRYLVGIVAAVALAAMAAFATLWPTLRDARHAARGAALT